jgi:hypothetical protein
MSEDILDQLNNLSNKWRWAQPEVRQVCEQAIYEIRLLREIQKVKNEYGSQRLAEGAD